MSINIRYDGFYEEWPTVDNLSFTFLDHFIGIDGRDYYHSSWTGIEHILKTGIRLEDIQLTYSGVK